MSEQPTANHPSRAEGAQEAQPSAVSSFVSPTSSANFLSPRKNKLLSPRFLLALLLALSFLFGLICLLQYRYAPFYTIPVLDEESYVVWAQDIVSGGPRSRQVFYQDPLYPYFLALLFKIGGTPEIGKPHRLWFLIRFLQVILGTAGIALVFWAGKMVRDEWTGLVAALLLVLCRVVYYYELLLLKAVMEFFLAALCCALGVAAAGWPARKSVWGGLGAALALLSLVRGNFLLFLPVIIIWALWPKEGIHWRRRMGTAAMAGAGFILVLLPVSLRNYRLSGELVLTTSQAGTNFYGGNHEKAEGRGVNLDFVRPHPRFEAEDFKAEAERRTGRKMTPAEVSRFWFREGLRWIRANPGKAARLFLVKAQLMGHNYEVADNYSFYVVRQELVSALWIPFIGLGLLWGPALAGVLCALPRQRRLIFPALFLVLYSLSVIVFFVISRYRMAALPAVALLAGAFIFWIKDQFKIKKYKKAVAGVILSTAVMIVSFAPIPEDDISEAYNTLAMISLAAGRIEDGLVYFDKALEIHPGEEDVLENLGRALELMPPDPSFLLGLARRLEARGRTGVALPLYEKVVHYDSGSFEVLVRLGTIYGSNPEFRDLHRALEYLEQARALRPTDIPLLFIIGNCHFQLGNFEAARSAWEEVLALDPSHADARRNLGVLLRLRPIPP